MKYSILRISVNIVGTDNNLEKYRRMFFGTACMGILTNCMVSVSWDHDTNDFQVDQKPIALSLYGE